MPQSITTTIHVAGMSCQHCVASVTEELSDVAGVQRVDVDLTEGTVSVTGGALDDEAVRAAISTAGYEVLR